MADILAGKDPMRLNLHRNTQSRFSPNEPPEECHDQKICNCSSGGTIGGHGAHRLQDQAVTRKIPCALISERWRDQLDQRSDDSSPTPMDGDLTENISIMTDRALVLAEAAEKTKDENLKQALNAAAGNDTKMAQILAK